MKPALDAATQTPADAAAKTSPATAALDGAPPLLTSGDGPREGVRPSLAASDMYTGAPR